MKQALGPEKTSWRILLRLGLGRYLSHQASIMQCTVLQCTTLPLHNNFIIIYPVCYQQVDNITPEKKFQMLYWNSQPLDGWSRSLNQTKPNHKVPGTIEEIFLCFISKNLLVFTLPNSLVLHMSTQNVQSIKYKISLVSSLPCRYVGTLQNSRNSWAPPINIQDRKGQMGACSVPTFSLLRSHTSQMDTVYIFRALLF